MGQSSFSDKIATLGVYTIFRQTDDAASFFTLSEFILPMYCYYCLGWRCFPSQAISFNGMAISLCLELHGDWKTPIPKSPRNGGFSVAVVNYLRVHTKYYIYILYIYIHIHTQCLYSAAVVYNHILCIFLIAPTHWAQGDCRIWLGLGFTGRIDSCRLLSSTQIQARRLIQ